MVSEHSIAGAAAHGSYCLQPRGDITYTGGVKTLERHYRNIDSCLVVIDRDTGLVLESFGNLPFSVPEGVVGRDWRDALAIPCLLYTSDAADELT